jgi:hypothetical protein
MSELCPPTHVFPRTIVSLPEPEKVARRMRDLRRPPRDAEADPRVPAKAGTSGPSYAFAAPDADVGRHVPTEVVALRDLVDGSEDDPADRADRARRTAAIYLRERRRRLRSELTRSPDERDGHDVGTP